MSKALRPYQEAAKHAFFEAVESGSAQALVVMATGLGKTFTAAEIYEEWRNRFGGKAIFVVHLADVAEQALDEFQAHLSDEVVCGILTGDRSEHVLDCDILFTTFQSMHATQRRIFNRDYFNLMIVDEAHHGHAATYRPVIRYFQTRMTLGLTATPDRADGQDIRTLFGEEIFTYTLAQGVAEGYLAEMDYRVETDNIDNDRLRELVRRVSDGDRSVSKSDIDGTIFLYERLEAIEKRVREVEEEHGRRLKKIIFCRNLTHVRAVRKFFADAISYHSQMDRERQREALQDFKDGKVLEILVRDKFNEGVDVPDAEMLVFLRGTQSMTIWLQQLGRGLRLTGDKSHIVVLDFVANCDRLREVHGLASDIRKVQNGNGDREREGRERLHIEGTGWSFNFTEEARDILRLFDQVTIPFYATYEEAREAARRLELPGYREYMQSYTQDPRLPSTPERQYADDWVDWYDFLGNEAPTKFYPKLSQAMEAVQQLGISSRRQYLRRRKEDDGLPSCPHEIYEDEWVDWPHFLGKETNQVVVYGSLHQAAQAVQALGVKSGAEYRRRYREDPSLPSHPDYTYSSEWTSWYDFLGKARPSSFSSYDEAMIAARGLGITSGADYKRRYREHPRLPSKPEQAYRERWTSWPDFLGVRAYKRRPRRKTYYETCALASEAAQRLGIRTWDQYRTKYKEDPLLPSRPNVMYKAEWQNWPHFLGTE